MRVARLMTLLAVLLLPAVCQAEVPLYWIVAPTHPVSNFGPPPVLPLEAHTPVDYTPVQVLPLSAPRYSYGWFGVAQPARNWTKQRSYQGNSREWRTW